MKAEDITNMPLGPCVDSASMTGVTSKQENARLTGNKRFVQGVQGTGKAAEEAEIAFGTVDSNGTPILLHLQDNPGLYIPDANGDILPQAPLIRSGIVPQWKTGTTSNPCDGGHL
eukprot:2693336-Rhodomonas_salina.2